MLRYTAVVTTVLATLLVSPVLQECSAADLPSDRVVAMYFHRTERCPTCKKMGSYAEETVTKRFAKQVSDKSVTFHFVDFQDKKNSKLTNAYKITGPALIVVRVRGNKVAEYKNLKDIWAKVSDKEAFCEYVEDSITAYAGK